MTETARIHWTDDDETGEAIGCVGTLNPAAFRIWEASEGGEWLLASILPGHQGARTYGDNPETLKAAAERWLAGFVFSLGAVFPEDEISDDEDEEPVGVRFAAGRRVRFAHPDAGYPGEAEDAARHLTLGGVYTVAWADIGQSRTDLNLAAEGKPAGRFNSVFFEPADDQVAAVKAGED